MGRDPQYKAISRAATSIGRFETDSTPVRPQKGGRVLLQYKHQELVAIVTPCDIDRGLAAHHENMKLRLNPKGING